MDLKATNAIEGNCVWLDSAVKGDPNSWSLEGVSNAVGERLMLCKVWTKEDSIIGQRCVADHITLDFVSVIQDPGDGVTQPAHYTDNNNLTVYWVPLIFQAVIQLHYKHHVINSR